jgi:hypothetical protein
VGVQQDVAVVPVLDLRDTWRETRKTRGKQQVL